jgi:hypothetical protein
MSFIREDDDPITVAIIVMVVVFVVLGILGHVEIYVRLVKGGG